MPEPRLFTKAKEEATPDRQKLPDWMHERACRDADPRKFDASTGEAPTSKRVLLAKETCQGCPVRVECLEFGINEEFGVFGGLAPVERKALREGRNAAAGTNVTA